MDLIDKLTAIGDAIREKSGKTDLLTLDQMVTEISALEVGGSASLASLEVVRPGQYATTPFELKAQATLTFKANYEGVVLPDSLIDANGITLLANNGGQDVVMLVGVSGTDWMLYVIPHNTLALVYASSEVITSTLKEAGIELIAGQWASLDSTASRIVDTYIAAPQIILTTDFQSAVAEEDLALFFTDADGWDTITVTSPVTGGSGAVLTSAGVSSPAFSAGEIATLKQTYSIDTFPASWFSAQPSLESNLLFEETMSATSARGLYFGKDADNNFAITEVRVETDSAGEWTGNGSISSYATSVEAFNESLGGTISTTIPLNTWFTRTTPTAANIYVDGECTILNATVPYSDGALGAADVCRTVVIPCQPNTAYAISLPTNGYNRFQIAETSSLPEAGDTVQNRAAWTTAYDQRAVQNGRDYCVATTMSTSNYLCIYYYHASYDADEGAIRANLMVTEGGEIIPFTKAVVEINPPIFSVSEESQEALSAVSFLFDLSDRAWNYVDISVPVNKTQAMLARTITSLTEEDFDGITTIGASALRDCTQLVSVVIPEGVTTFSSNVFTSCTALESVSLPNSLAAIGSSTFYGCSKLTELTIPEGITNTGWYLCNSCSSLKQITFAGAVSAIGGYAFRDCTALETIDFSHATTVPNLQSTTAFTNVPAECQVLIPASLAETWKSASNWVDLSVTYVEV